MSEDLEEMMQMLRLERQHDEFVVANEDRVEYSDDDDEEGENDSQDDVNDEQPKTNEAANAIEANIIIVTSFREKIRTHVDLEVSEKFLLESHGHFGNGRSYAPETAVRQSTLAAPVRTVVARWLHGGCTSSTRVEISCGGHLIARPQSQTLNYWNASNDF